mmetsp:Transcript_8933/g.12394  ORF Transcript_8933/g.12394 Transcript_8933/m.12394 type:complete len:473 (-) Transcript_8933:31-1449(-)
MWNQEMEKDSPGRRASMSRQGWSSPVRLSPSSVLCAAGNHLREPCRDTSSWPGSSRPSWGCSRKAAPHSTLSPVGPVRVRVAPPALGRSARNSRVWPGRWLCRVRNRRCHHSERNSCRRGNSHGTEGSGGSGKGRRGSRVASSRVSVSPSARPLQGSRRLLREQWWPARSQCGSRNRCRGGPFTCSHTLARTLTGPGEDSLRARATLHRRSSNSAVWLRNSSLLRPGSAGANAANGTTSSSSGPGRTKKAKVPASPSTCSSCSDTPCPCPCGGLADRRKRQAGAEAERAIMRQVKKWHCEPQDAAPRSSTASRPHRSGASTWSSSSSRASSGRGLGILGAWRGVLTAARTDPIQGGGWARTSADSMTHGKVSSTNRPWFSRWKAASSSEAVPLKRGEARAGPAERSSTRPARASRRKNSSSLTPRRPARSTAPLQAAWSAQALCSSSSRGSESPSQSRESFARPAYQYTVPR